MEDQRLYFIPGREELLDGQRGQLLASMGYAVYGREIVSDFARLGFSEQLAVVKSDLQQGFYHPEGILVGRSYGAYLLLHTLADMAPFPGKILLSSPVLGAAVAKGGFFGSRPPRSERLIDLAAHGAFPSPHYMEIHTGAEDNGCSPLLAERFVSRVGNTKLFIVTGAGHELSEPYLQVELTRFLGTEPGPLTAC